MRPTLVSLPIGDHEVGLHTYGVLVAVGFTVGIVLFWREGRRQGFDGGRLLDLAFWSIVAGMVGSRLAFVALNAREFIDACVAADGGGGGGGGGAGRLSGCTAIFRFWEGGLVFYGGAIGAAGVILAFCQREGWSFWRLADVSAPTLAVGHAIGRLGCFFAGCCFGKPCDAPWAVSFPPASVAFEDLRAVGLIGRAAARTPRLHPTQLYEAAGELAIFGVLLALRRRARAREAADDRGAGAPGAARPGYLILVYAGAYAALRFAVEIFRGDAARRFVFEWSTPGLSARLGLPRDQPLFLSVSQLASALVIVGVVVALGWRRRHATSA